jgi:hypothetical protein
LVEAGQELRFTTPRQFALSMQAADVQKALERLDLAARRVKITVSEAAAPAPESTPAAAPAEDEATLRALAHPGVLRFREAFPDAEVRVVRNLKE